jgi:hypothetical protein
MRDGVFFGRVSECEAGRDKIDGVKYKSNSVMVPDVVGDRAQGAACRCRFIGTAKSVAGKGLRRFFIGYGTVVCRQVAIPRW